MVEYTEDLARLARLTRRVAAFATAAAGAFYFFAYGMAVIGFILLASSLSPAAGSWSIALIVGGVLAGIIVATILVTVVAGPLWRYLARQGLYQDTEGWRPMLGFIPGFTLAYITTPLIGEWYAPIAWYPGLGISLLLAGVISREQAREYLIYSGLGILATLPLPLLLEYSYPGHGNAAASGLVLLVYLIVGGYSMKKAAELFEEA